MKLHSRLSKQNAVLWRLALNQRQQPLPLIDEFKRILIAATSLLEVQRGSIWLYRDNNTQLDCIVLFDVSTGAFSTMPALTRHEYPLYFQACATNKYIDADDAATDPRTSELASGYLQNFNIVSMLDAPIYVGSNQKGVICLETTGTQHVWDEEDKAFAGSVADLIALALAEEDSAQALSFIESAMENAAEAVLVVNKAGLITRFNNAAAALFAVDRSRKPAVHINMLLPDVFNGSDGLLDQVFASSSPQFNVKSADGFLANGRNNRTIPVVFSISKIKHWRGEHALVLLSDNSEKYEKEQMLRNSEALYRNVVEDQPDLIIRTDNTGHITFANRSTLQYFGLTLAQMLGTSVYDYVPESDHVIVKTSIAAINKDDPVARYVHNITTRDLSQRVISWLVRGFFSDAGVLTAFQAIGRDITREREAEEKLRMSQKLESLAVLAGGMAHDFNNLLTPILSFTDLAKTTLPQDLPQINYLNYVLTAANRARDLARMVLVFSRRDERRERQNIPAGPFVREIADFLRKVTDARIQFIDHIDLGAGNVQANPSDLYQILSNLCTNAIQAMPAGGVLSVSCSRVDRDNTACLQLEVKDTGSGIPLDIQDRIFEPFFTTKSKSQGTGLGLSVVKGLIDELGGEIFCKSEPGKGTAFVCYIPLSSATPVAEDHDTDKLMLLGSERILVVDDEASITIAIRDGLQQLGYWVEARTSANEALAEFAEHGDSYHLVVTDYTMPYMNGFELARNLRQIRDDLPVILMSGYGQMVKSSELEAANIAAFVQKPFIMEDLATVIRQVLRNRGQPAAAT